MGTKSTVKLRKRGKAFKCDLCGRKLMSPDALKAHQRTAHNIIKVKSRDAKPVKITKTVKTKPIKKAASSSKVTPKRNNERTIKENDKSKKTQKQEQIRRSKVQFECPRCFRLFLTYFTTHKHILEFHCVNEQGFKVLPNSPDLIQPARLEMCQKCKRRVKSIQGHACEGNQASKDRSQYMCAGCDELFTNLRSFDIHVSEKHSDIVNSMVFTTNDEFQKWKTDMEQNTNVNYTAIENDDKITRYRCKSVKDKPKKPNTTYICPSTIVIRELADGIQVDYFKIHHKHPFNEYKLINKYKKNLNIKENDIEKEENVIKNDLYIKFKMVMENIVSEAAEVSEAKLKKLLAKAIDLSSIITKDEKIEPKILNHHSLTDSQISKELEQDTAPKRKFEDDIVDVKRPKLSLSPTSEAQSPKIVNSFSLANADLAKTTENEHQSFNDTYKDFVVKNFPEVEIKKRTRNVTKTKVGQFKPSPPKEIKKLQVTDKPRSKVDFDYEVKEQRDGCNILILKI